MRGNTLAAPELIDLEVTSVWRRQVRAGQLELRRADLALADLLVMPLQRVAHRRLLNRSWALRDTLTPYDAAYVALAELLEVVLVTGDRRLSQVPGVRSQIEVVG
ncbi:type II toxin-antitoxin system VapC family toxin [Saxibacter everestensis]|uniref:Type II toxin-antitoxin system VapC family toxin n=1 Tax=Saxibacter everestensis TaxID=2909229 RepID=A0ABY8QVB4_9MICO|nr:type II toxin-antitoxin system VapC family toxin [Brevibacteriaceae bacterium ZFBP1038]